MANFGVVSAAHRSSIGLDYASIGFIAVAGNLLRELGRWSDEYEVRAFHFRKIVEVLGEEHSDTLVSMNSLSFTTQGQGRNLDAIKLMAECVHLQGMFLLARLWRLARVWGCF